MCPLSPDDNASGGYRTPNGWKVMRRSPFLMTVIISRKSDRMQQEVCYAGEPLSVRGMYTWETATAAPQAACAGEQLPPKANSLSSGFWGGVPIPNKKVRQRQTLPPADLVIPAASSCFADAPGHFPDAGSGCESAPARTAPAAGRRSGPWPKCRGFSAPAESGWW